MIRVFSVLRSLGRKGLPPSLVVLLGLCSPVLAPAQCASSGVQAAQGNAATQGDIQLMQQAGTFVFGTVMQASGVGTVANVFDTLLSKGLGANTDVVGAELACEQAEISALNTEIASLSTELQALTLDFTNASNTTLKAAIDQDVLVTLSSALADLSGTPGAGPRSSRFVNQTLVSSWGKSAPQITVLPMSPPVDEKTAYQAAIAAKGVADLYLKDFDSRWVAYDLPSRGANPAATFEPYPGLHAYLLAMQVWMSAMEIEERDLGSSSLAWNQRKGSFWPDLSLHLSFLKSRAQGGRGQVSQALGSDDPLPDMIRHQVVCSWSASSYAGGSLTPSSGNQCRVMPSCSDAIQRKTWNAGNSPPAWNAAQTYSFGVANSNTACTFDPRNTPPIAMEASLDDLYGLGAVNDMEGVVAHMVATGYMYDSPQTGTFGTGTSGATLVQVYALDSNGAVYRAVGAGSQKLGVPRQVALGWSNVRALLPGGGGAFYTVDDRGVLRWYNFLSTTAPPSGPVQLSMGFGSYQKVFGGSDGVIYAIAPGGNLYWYRHTDPIGGGGPATLTGPKLVGTGWGQFQAVFSAGGGVIYALKSDGTLLWYHHRDYLTGASADTTAAGPALGGRLLMQARSAVPRAHWDGPLQVASGWNDLRSVQGAGDGAIIAVRSNGTVLWYRHDDYLTGVSSGSGMAMSRVSFTRMSAAAALSPSTTRGVAHWEGPIPIASGWQKYALTSASLAPTVTAVVK
jgi:Tachylectin